ncbi:hypothetical protein AB4186_09390 [Vibrio lentus]
MNTLVSIDAIQRRNALDEWLDDCQNRMNIRFPKIDFESDKWPIRSLHQANQPDFYFTETFASLAKCDRSYREILRCVIAEQVLAGKPKDLRSAGLTLREFARNLTTPVWDISIRDLRQFESRILEDAKKEPSRYSYVSACAAGMEKITNLLVRKRVLPALGYFRTAQFKHEINTLRIAREQERKRIKNELLDHKIEAFNEAFNAMIENPVDSNGIPLLNNRDVLAICSVGIGLCAPSRINEVLTMGCNDYVTVEDYLDDIYGSDSEAAFVLKAHQMLVITHKGSKGAEWGPKPALNFMIDVFHYCIEKIKELGTRSRMLAEWYEKHPNKLYLPNDLEHLRGQTLTVHELGQIVSLSSDESSKLVREADKVLRALKDKRFLTSTPKIYNRNGKHNTRSRIYGLKWDDAEKYLLKKVHNAMSNCRKVSAMNYYEGKLANMLFLFDESELSYLPTATNYQAIRKRLKRLATSIDGYETPPTIFEKLNITMPVNGKIEVAHLALHDARRWLTTQALIHGENLSDVLINKWANRSSLSQLKAYDFRTSESIAEASSMPKSHQVKVLSDFSNGLDSVEKLEEQFGLERAIVTAQDAGIAVTSMNAISQAIEERPIASCSRGIIVLYPTLFGTCLHQHHEKPCRNYSNDIGGACMTCNENIHVKGHIPTNDETRARAEKLFTIIIRHLENLAFTHNRSVADDLEALGEHMVTLVEKGLDRSRLEELASYLIDNFHEIKDLLKDRQLANRIEEAFVARGVVKRLDEPETQSGALIKYHDPSRHSEPLLEIALEEHGGRAMIQNDEAALIKKHPTFAPVSEVLRDERHLIEPDKNEDNI